MPDQWIRGGDNSNFANYQSKCGGKKRYSKKAHAEQVIQAMHSPRNKSRNRTAEDHELVAYRCDYCGGGYHVGNVPRANPDEDFSTILTVNQER